MSPIDPAEQVASKLGTKIFGVLSVRSPLYRQKVVFWGVWKKLAL